MVHISDTAHRLMRGEGKIAIACEMSMAARELCRARLREAHREWSEAQVARELLRLAFLPKPLPASF